MSAIKSIKELAESFITHERPVGVILDFPAIEAQLVCAARYYAAHASIDSLQNNGVDAGVWVDSATALNQCEWGLIRPLFYLYIERENAILLEASGTVGVQSYGRQSSEVSQEITQYESTLPQLSFQQPMITV